MTDPAAVSALARALYVANCFDPNSIYHEFKRAEVEQFAKDILRVPLTPAERAALAAAIAPQPADRVTGDAGLREALDAAYRERAAVVAALFRVGGYRTWRIPAPDAEGWWIVYAETPQGQVSWHVSATDIRLFDDVPVPVHPDPWDGHTTDEKYERVAALTGDTPEDKA